MVIHTTVTTLGLGCGVARSAFPSMFQSWDGQRHGRSYLREMELDVDVEGCMESWRGRVCPECQDGHIPSEGSVSKGVLWQAHCRHDGWNDQLWTKYLLKIIDGTSRHSVLVWTAYEPELNTLNMFNSVRFCIWWFGWTKPMVWFSIHKKSSLNQMELDRGNTTHIQTFSTVEALC